MVKKYFVLFLIVLFFYFQSSFLVKELMKKIIRVM